MGRLYEIDPYDSPNYRARETRVSLEHLDAAFNSLERAVDILRAGRFYGESPAERRGLFNGRHFQDFSCGRSEIARLGQPTYPEFEALLRSG